MPKYFDVHSHLQAPQYDQDREEVIERLKETDTHTIVVGTDFESSKQAVKLANQHDRIYATIGIHPTDKLESFEVSKFESLIKNPKVVAIGECGFDFYHAKIEDDYDRQKELFIAQIEFAKLHNKPLMIHARDAYKEILEVLEGIDARGNVHFFAGSWDVAKQFIQKGFTLSFTGVTTFTRDYDEVIKNAPIESIMAETDSPYVSPVPYRGRRNEPPYVSEVVKKIAEIRKEDFEYVRSALAQNALRMIM